MEAKKVAWKRERKTNLIIVNAKANLKKVLPLGKRKLHDHFLGDLCNHKKRNKKKPIRLFQT